MKLSCLWVASEIVISGTGSVECFQEMWPTGLIFVTDANPRLDSIKWIVKFNASATAWITSASALVPWCDILAK